MGFLDRLRGGGTGSVAPSRQYFETTVPLAHADDARAAIGEVAKLRGWTSAVRVQREGAGAVRLTLEHAEGMGGRPPDMSEDGAAEELQRAIDDAMKPEG